MYSKLSTEKSKSLLSSSSPSNPLIPSPSCVQIHEAAPNPLPPDKEPNQQALEDLRAILKTRLDLEDDQEGLSLGHCAVILEAFQNPQSHTIASHFQLINNQPLIPSQTIANITPAEYAAALAFTSEEGDFEVRAKFTYFQDTQELFVMSPLPVHEQPTSHINAAIYSFTHEIPYDKRRINVTMHTNHRLQSKNTVTHIPDLQLIISRYPIAGTGKRPRPIVKWIGECGFSSDDSSMIRKLREMTDSDQNIDLALMISVREIRWQQPKDGSIIAETLRSQPQLDYDDFIPVLDSKTMFGPVVVESHTWIHVKEIRYTVFERGTDGHFNFSHKAAEGTLFPTMNMNNVEQKLVQAAERLKLDLIVLMEAMEADALAVQRARESHPVFDPMWDAACDQISTAVCLSAYFRYLDWYSNKYGKRKGVAVQASSNPVTASSSDQTVASSSEQGVSLSTNPTSASVLSLDVVEPARVSKKLKVQLGPSVGGSAGTSQPENTKSTAAKSKRAARKAVKKAEKKAAKNVK